MFRHLASKVRVRACLMALALAMPGVAHADPQPPLQLNSRYGERIPVARRAGCPITIVELTDLRRAPETMGMIDGVRAVSGPADHAAWLHSVAENGLRVRGFTPTIALAGAEGAVPDEPADSSAFNIHLKLRSVWLTTYGLNRTGSVVLEMSASRGTQNHTEFYRGEIIMADHSGTRGEFSDLLDRTVAEALNAMADDLALMCAEAS
ncbi:MAG: hypothetical protein ABL871_19395 [Terricaulis sp.]